MPPEISVIAHAEKEIEKLSRIGIAFAMEHEADEKRARTFGLIIEEPGIFLAKHGFSDGKPHTIMTKHSSENKYIIYNINKSGELVYAERTQKRVDPLNLIRVIPAQGAENFPRIFYDRRNFLL